MTHIYGVIKYSHCGVLCCKHSKHTYLGVYVCIYMPDIYKVESMYSRQNTGIVKLNTVTKQTSSHEISNSRLHAYKQ